MRIDRCVCVDRPFASLLQDARDYGLSLEELGQCCGAGEGCGLCRPYLRRMLVTGQTVFHQIIVEVEPPDTAAG